jgi:SEC-C motif
MSKIGRNEPCPCGNGKKFKHCHGTFVDRARTASPMDGNEASLFGPKAALPASWLDSFAKAAQPRSYRIMPLGESAEIKEVAERNKVYWQEILFRAHFGASAGMMRLHEWLQGSQKAFEDGNVLMLAAGIRGLLEAAADTFKVFADAAATLADTHVIVRKAIKGSLSEQLALAPELESDLIHFAYARGIRPGEGIALHKAATARDDISVLVQMAPKALELYAMLCDYSHPAAPSVFRFAGERTTPDILTFDPAAGSARILNIVESAREVGTVALMAGAGTLVLMLKVLNDFSFAPVKTPWADSVDSRFVPVWADLQRRMADRRTAPKTASAEERERLSAELTAQYEPFGRSKPGKKR